MQFRWLNRTLDFRSFLKSYPAELRIKQTLTFNCEQNTYKKLFKGVEYHGRAAKHDSCVIARVNVNPVRHSRLQKSWTRIAAFSPSSKINGMNESLPYQNPTLTIQPPFLHISERAFKERREFIIRRPVPRK